MANRRLPRRNSRGQFIASARSSRTRSASTGKRRGRYRANPVVGSLRSIIYDRPGDPGPSYEHKAGDFGVVKRKSKAKLVAGKGGKLSISGMRWIPGGVGIVG